MHCTGPATACKEESTYQGLEVLKTNLHAEYVILDPNNPDLQRFVPAATERPPIWVQPREQDRQLALKLGGFALECLQNLEPLVGLPEEQRVPKEVRQMLEQGRWCATAATWCLRAAGHLSMPGAASTAAAPGDPEEPSRQQDLICCLLLVRCALAALALVADTGYEAAVRELSRGYAAVAEKVLGPAGVQGSLAAPPPLDSSDSQFRLTLGLLRQLLDSVLDLATIEEAYSHAFAGLSSHPKFLALKGVLLEKAGLQQFKGIVFARTREAVRSLTSLIRACPDLQSMEIYSFMGHGGRKGEGGVKGMRVREQQQVMEAFKAPGRKLLFSTAAGEEGIDAPNCEFVVRYTATQTGRERIQSRGRTRMAGSEYIEILEAGQEAELSAKSAREEAYLHQALRDYKATRI